MIQSPGMTANSPEKLDELTPQQLIAEIRQIALQYAAEVPGTRRNWPESIRSRILALGRLGIPKKRISDLTAVPAATVFLWCRELPRAGRRRSGQFIELRNTPIPPTVGIPKISPTVGMNEPGTLLQNPVMEKPQGLTLRAPDGFSFEGLNSLADVVQLYRELCR